MFQKKWLTRYAALYLAVAIAGALLLYLTGLLPQDRVRANLCTSALQFEQEGQFPYLFNSRSDAYRVDAYSESLILNHAYFMDTHTSPVSIVQNPSYRDGWHPVDSLLKLAQDETLAANSDRSHYWLGFRTVVRPLLTLMPYQDIRGVLSAAFFALFLCAAFLLYQQADIRAAACLALTVIVMNPIIVSASLQYSCCFFLAFAGVIAVCRLHKKPAALYVVFLLLGQLTQYFDFYTAPVITWGLPFAALLSIQKSTFRKGMAQLGLTLGLWAGAYAGMWFLKMILTTLFTEENGFAIFSHFLYYTGVTEPAEGLVRFTPWGALSLCLKNTFTPANILLLGVCMISLIVYWITHRRELIPGSRAVWCYAIVAALPVIWLLCASQASGRHSYFQYRTLTASVFAGLMFVTQLFERKKA